MPKPTKNNVPFELFDPREIEMSTSSNDWYIVPLTVIGTVIAFIALVGPEDFFNVMVRFVTSI